MTGCVLWILLPAFQLMAAEDRLADAAMRADIAAVRSLLQESADVNETQPDGSTALHWAAHANNAELTELLIRAGADPKAATRNGATPLYLASLNGNAAVIELLLKAGADASAALPGGETALMTAARTGRADAVRVLLEHGADVNARETVKGQTALMWAAAEDHADVVKLLVDHGADIRACTNIDMDNSARGFIITTQGVPTLPCTTGGRRYVRPAPAQGAAPQRTPGPPLGGSGGGGMTPLLFAVREGAVDAVNVLLAAGSDVNETMADGTSAMIVAIINGRYELASSLLDMGADPNVADMRGRAALYAAVDMRNYRWSELPKPTGDLMDPIDLIERILAKNGDPNVRLTSAIPYRGPSNFSNIFQSMVGATPFLRAAESGDTRVMRLLLAYGADPHIKLADNTTALMLASGVGNADGSTFEWSEDETLEAVKLCLELGIDVQWENRDRMTALHGAAHRGSNTIVHYLVARGADLKAKDSDGRLPLNWAEGVVIIDQRPPRPQPHTVALIRELMNQPTAANLP
jgi:ankyrin